MKKFSHWTPRYVWNRVGVSLYQWRRPDAPWLTSQAIHFLENWLKVSDVGLEFGSGRSTVWFAQRSSGLTSVEHDRSWYELITKKLQSAGLKNVEYLYRPVGVSAVTKNEEGYAAVAEKFADNSLDYVLVDGAERSACALATIQKVRPGGILIIDNVNWALSSRTRSPSSRSVDDGPVSEQWQAFQERVATWRYLWTSNGVTDTAIYFRSCSSEF